MYLAPGVPTLLLGRAAVFPDGLSKLRNNQYVYDLIMV